jgi:hypothetical protein
MKAIVYDVATGAIRRRMTGAVPLENQRLADDEGILVSEPVSNPPSHLAEQLTDDMDIPPMVGDYTVENGRLVEVPAAAPVDWAAEWQAASTVEEKLDVLARKAGIDTDGE